MGGEICKKLELTHFLSSLFLLGTGEKERQILLKKILDLTSDTKFVFRTFKLASVQIFK